MDQLTIFDMMYPKYKITKPIRLIEFFAGYGSQALALKYLGVPFEHWKICEWAIKSIQAYKDIHFENDNNDYLALQPYSDKEKWLTSWLFEKGISSNYDEPMTKQQIMRLSFEQKKKIFNNICSTNNLVNIQQVKGKDLEIIDTDEYDYILTYSFPCQDLSLAGKGKGMSDTSTRSGMLWEVERILSECYELGTLPQCLVMENVPQVHQSGDNAKNFLKWQSRLEELGYKSYVQDLIATDYGIPQTRNRCFMISILGDYSYTFPKPIPLKLKLKDMLEDNVDEKYYLSDKMIKCFTRETNGGKFPRGDRFKQALKLTNEKGIVGTITTAAGNRATDNFIKENMKTELCNNLIKDGKVKENDVIRHSYTTSRTNDWDKRSVEQNNLSPTLDTRCDCLGVCVKGIATNESEDWQKPPLEEKSRTILANKSNGGVGLIDTDLRIRKLTPKECFRLMGVKDEDYDKVKVNQSDSSLYHLAGDSIVVNVLMAIFKELLEIEEI